MAKPISSYRNFNEFWSGRVEKFGDAPCLTDGENSEKILSFAQVNDYTNRTAYLLREEGLECGNRFMVLAENCLGFFFLYLASLKLGTLIMPVTPTLSEDEISAIMDRFEPVLIFADENRMNLARRCLNSKKYIKKLFCIGWADPKCEEESLINVLSSLSDTNVSYDDVKLSDPGSLYCSSGTTGKPKAIPQSPLNLLTAAESLHRAYGFGHQDTQMGILPVYHTALVTYGFWPGVFAGSNFVLFKKFSRSRFWKDLERYDIAFAETVPTILAMLLNPPEDIRQYDLSRLKFIGSGSAPLPNSLWKEFEETFGIRIANKYGLSETAPTHFNPPTPEFRKEGSIGRALDMCDVQVFDDNNREKAVGKVGEFVMRGDNVVKGYFQDPKETAAAFRDGWFHSGDIGYKDDDGFFFIVGRKKEIIIRGGVNIYPVEIDNILTSHPDVVEAVSFGLPDKFYGEEVCAVVRLKPECKTDTTGLLSYCQLHLAMHKCPKQIFVAESIPKTASGKPLRKTLTKMYKDCQDVQFPELRYKYDKNTPGLEINHPLRGKK